MLYPAFAIVFLGAISSCTANFSDEPDANPIENDTYLDVTIDTGEGIESETNSDSSATNGNTEKEEDVGNASYICKENAYASYCIEGEEEKFMVLECGKDGTIDTIDFASFGNYLGSCSESVPSIGICHSARTFSVLEKKCLGKQSCQLVVDKAVFGNPCEGIEYRLIVEYTCYYESCCDGLSSKRAPGKCGCDTPDYDRDGDGSADCNDKCKTNPDKIEPGLCGCKKPDVSTDTDLDGTVDCNDGCPYDIYKTEPGVCGCGNIESADEDADGALDCIDGCAADPKKTEAGQCGCGIPDKDSDKDGTADCIDECDYDHKKIVPGICGCGVKDDDTDGDMVVDCMEECPKDPEKTVPGICGCGIPDKDTDKDSVLDCHEECPNDREKTMPGICGCGIPDVDSDGDGFAICEDGCPNDANKIEPGNCGCGHSEESCYISCVEAADHESALLDCGENAIIESIEFASFGDPKGSCNGPAPSFGKCDADGAVSVIEDTCLGQKFCTIQADKKILGDPKCKKKVEKHLIVEYLCRYTTM